MNIRVALTEDIMLLISLRMQIRKERDDSFDESILRPATESFFRKNIRSSDHVAFIAGENGEVVGTVGLTLFEMPPTSKLPNGKVAKLMNMYTLPKYRKRGIEKRMLGYTVDYVSQHGHHKVMLNSSSMGQPF